MRLVPTEFRLERLRVPFGFLAAIAYFWFARPNVERLVEGASLALAGIVVRAWAAGHIVKNSRLATTGPYAFTRNPLYFGSFLIACGFAVMAQWWLLLVVAAFWAVVYGPVMRQERDYVRALYPAEYAEWEQHVPMFIPRLTPWHADGVSGSSRFDPTLYIRHREWQAGVGYLVALAILTAKLRFDFLTAPWQP